MNYLAHALLSPEDPEILMGNLWGDLIKPRDYPMLSPGIRAGVQRHKMVDAYTDIHYAVDRMTTLFRPYQGKYTPVVVDVVMDYMLSLHWGEYHATPLEDFCQVVYIQVTDFLGELPSRLHPRISRMLDHKWLESCKNRERMEQTLQMLSRRASFSNRIPEALIPYDAHREELHELFHLFFQDVRRHINLQSED